MSAFPATPTTTSYDPSEISQTTDIFVAAIIFTVLSGLMVCIAALFFPIYSCIRHGVKCNIACFGYVFGTYFVITIPLIVCNLIMWAIYYKKLRIDFDFTIIIDDTDYFDDKLIFGTDNEQTLFWTINIVPISISIILWLFLCINCISSSNNNTKIGTDDTDDERKGEIYDKTHDENQHEALEREEPFEIGPLNEENREEMLRIQRNLSFGLK